MINRIQNIIELLSKTTKSFKIKKDDYVYEYYLQAKNDIRDLKVKPIKTSEIAEIFIESPFLKRYIELINNIDAFRLYISECHGINHNIRVSLFVYILSVFEGVTMREFEILMECAKYHDIGRTSDRKDDNHGLESAKKIDFLKDMYSEQELNIMRAVITCHSLEDSQIDKYMDIYNIEDKAQCRRLFAILKDSDGLDRVRLHYPKIEVDMLRTRTAKQIILFAFEMYVMLLNL